MLRSFSLSFRSNEMCKLLKGGNTKGSALLCLVSNLLAPGNNGMVFRSASMHHQLPMALRSVFLIPRRFRLPPMSLIDCVRLGDSFCPHFDGRSVVGCLRCFRVSVSVGLNSLSVNRGGGMFVDFTLTAGASLLLVSRPAGKLSVPKGDRFHGFVTSKVSSSGAVIVSARRIHSVSGILSRMLVVSRDHMLLSRSADDVYRGLFFMRDSSHRLTRATLFTVPAVRNGCLVLPGGRGRRSSVGLRLLFGTALTTPRRVTQLFRARGWGAVVGSAFFDLPHFVGLYHGRVIRD